MAAVNSCQRVKGSPINASSPFADRTLTLSEVDSLYQNGEWTSEQCYQWALNQEDARILLPLVTAMEMERK